MLIRYILFVSLCFIFNNKIAAQSICAGGISASTNLAYIQFQAKSLKIDEADYFEDDIWLNAMFYDEELGFTCGGRVQYDGGFPITMALIGKDAFIKNGFSENTRIVLIAETVEGCILDSLQVFLAENTEEKHPDSLYFSFNKLFEVKSIKAKMGDCLLTSTLEINKEENFKVYPNPATQVINLHIDFPKSTTVYINLINTTGQSFYQKKIKAQKLTHQIPIYNLPPGVFFLEFLTQKGRVIKKVIISK